MENEKAELHELRDGKDVAKVRPCRICGCVPTFYWFDSETENWYHLGCDKCGIANIQKWGYDKLVEAWNNHEVDIATWMESVDYQ